MNKKRTKIYSNLIRLVIVFIIILLLHIIFKPKNNLLIPSLVYIVNAILIPEWIKDKKMILRHKAFLIIITFILSSATIFYLYGFEKNKFYILWFFIIVSVGTVVTTISKLIKDL